MIAPAIVLLVVLVLAAYGPEPMAAIAGGTVAAWDYVLNGVQSLVMWLGGCALARHWLLRAVCILGAWEAWQRPVCRAMFPMDRPPQTGGVPLCEAAFGAPVAWLGVVLALFVALLTQEAQRAEAPR
jgi:hypothetical protein